MFLTSSTWFLLLLIAVPLVAYKYFRQQRDAIAFSSTEAAAGLPKTLRQRLTWVPPALGLTALTLVIVAMARPQEGRKETITDSEGIAIEMVVDRSGSMQAMDFTVDGKPVDRLTAIKDVAGKFIHGENGTDGRIADLVGLVSFAGNADGLVPPTLDHTYVTSHLNSLEIVDRRSEDGTAIGDGIGLAIEKLADLDLKAEESDQFEKIKGKVIILLTDGENNAGQIDPIPAAELAKSFDIKIYTIGVGTKGQAPVPVTDPYTGERRVQMMSVNIDEDTLQKVAEETGGKYFRATNSQSLAAIYAEIDQLEKSRVEARHLMDYRELAIEPIQFGGTKIPSLISMSMFCLAAQLLLSNTVLRET